LWPIIPAVISVVTIFLVVVTIFAVVTLSSRFVSQSVFASQNPPAEVGTGSSRILIHISAIHVHVQAIV
jgi:hypothetical protein